MIPQSEINERLKKAAYEASQAFCYGCYSLAPTGRCTRCGSDDLMRHVEGVGAEYGTDWIIRYLLMTHLQPVNGDELFEELLDACYPEVKIGGCTFSPSRVLKKLDPICFTIGAAEYLNHLVENGQLYEHDGDYYRAEDIEAMLDKLDA